MGLCYLSAFRGQIDLMNRRTACVGAGCDPARTEICKANGHDSGHSDSSSEYVQLNTQQKKGRFDSHEEMVAFRDASIAAPELLPCC
jgi:hypothetical protein